MTGSAKPRRWWPRCAALAAVVFGLVALGLAPPPVAWYARYDSTGRILVDKRLLQSVRVAPLVSWALRAAHEPAKRWVSFDVDELLASARARARLPAAARFWVDVEAGETERVDARTDRERYAGTYWMRFLETFADEVARSPTVSAFGRLVLRDQLVKSLSFQLRVVDLVERHPEILDETVERPIVVAGPPRTMTTHAQSILGQHPDLRYVSFYEANEALDPAGVPADVLGTERDPRVFLLEVAEYLMWYLRPLMVYMFKHGPFLPAEDIHFMEPAMASPTFEIFGVFPRYSKLWLESRDNRSAYRMLRLMQRVVQWQERTRAAKLGRPYHVRRWIMKTPEHAFHLRDLYAIYPDALLVLTHRDVASVTGSYIPMVTYVSGFVNFPVDAQRMAEYLLDANEARWNHLVDEFDEVVPPSQALMVPFKDFVKDNLGWAVKMLRFAGLDSSPAVVDKLRRFIESSPREGANRFKYDIQSFGPEFEPDALRRRFARYERRFGEFF